jgi:ABC-type Co2+ transport system permease subunit
MKTNRNSSGLLQNWNYIVAGIIFLAYVYYDSSWPRQVSADNEMIYLLTVLPAFMYFLILHPLMWADDE